MGCASDIRRQKSLRECPHGIPCLSTPLLRCGGREGYSVRRQRRSASQGNEVKLRQAAAVALLSLLLAVAVGPEAVVAGVIIERKYTQVVNPGDGDCPLIEIIQGHKMRTGPMVPKELGWSLP